MSQAQSSILVSMNINWTKEIMIKYRVFQIWLWTLYEKVYVQLSSGEKKVTEFVEFVTRSSVL